MAIFNDDHVAVPGLVLWDGISKPEAQDGGGFKHSIRIAVLDAAPEMAELTQVATNCLNASEFKGVLPPGANWPFMACDVNKFGPLVAGRTGVSGITYNGAPTVFDVNGQEVPAQMVSGLLYPGAEVEVILSPRAYNNKQKGIGFWVQGVKSINSTLPKLDVGSGLGKTEAANMFFQTAGATGAPPQQAAGLPPQPQTAAAPPPPQQQAAGAVPPPPGAVVQPNAAFTQGPVHNMTAAAGGVPYEQWIAQKWTDEALIAQGYMTA